ncbi:mannose-6-phosphate isomerase, class I [Nocardioides sp. YIM 152315]|uniref:mannose-6-phosphate isomerase, class I n=1 Tax=Nocardioides sp. YIM 152315 TaxID=3031760 RepID=UPI0023DC5CD0|nr:mannose-6-phosphate isomerase, class I [Nocardioides sp. YIM 152315]MDF1604989.1 mannose-6-phosphate isomerase, class I [Nocardioides sp. YIM 152315]
MQQLTCATRDYAWGSPTLIPRFLDLPADGRPQAELWVGAHPGAPSRLPDGTRLDEHIGAYAEDTLGARTLDIFGPRLPYLVKALAAAEPLSLQVHPTTERARIGYDLEDQAGIPIGAPERSYQDRFHKPEMLVAITRFEGMAGFRDVEKTIRILRLLEHPWADRVAKELGAAPPFQALHRVVGEILDQRGDPLRRLVAEIAAAATAAERRGHQSNRISGRIYLDRSSVERESTRLFAQTAVLAEQYPEDPGVLVTLLLNHVVLSPGEAMFLDAGVVHAYSSGFGVEIMAASDNVVRAGLTPKHVDVPELLHIANFTPIPAPIWEPTTVSASTLRYEPPVAEFALTITRAPEARLPGEGPRTLLCLDGEVEVVGATVRLGLRKGQALFVPHADGAVELGGDGTVAIASVPAG